MEMYKIFTIMINRFRKLKEDEIDEHWTAISERDELPAVDFIYILICLLN